MRKDKKDKINALMNIDSYFGEHQGRLGPMVLFLCVSATPFIIYVTFLTLIIPLKWILIFEVPFTFRMALLILGRENERLKVYKKERQDEFASANDLIRISHIHEDGLIEYSNGVVAYILSAFTTTYTNDSKFSIDLEDFLHLLAEYDYDIHCHMVIDEDRLHDNLEEMHIYKDPDIMQERIEFYKLQDEYCKNNSKLFRINFLVKASKYDWKKLRRTLESAIVSTDADVFKICNICDRDLVSDVASRDICAYVDLESMLQEKFSNDEYFGARVLYYGDEVPDEYKEERDLVDLYERRVVKHMKE